MKVYIKNMVCQGTRKFVLSEMKRLGLKLSSFIGGELEFQRSLSPDETCNVEASLKKYGLVLMFEKPEYGISYSLYHPDFESVAEGITEEIEPFVSETEFAQVG